MNQQRYNEPDFKYFLEQLLASGRIEGKEAGITKFVIDNDYDSLFDKQKYVFDSMIERNTVKECKGDGIDIPWCEMLEALDNGGYCNYCQHMMEKIEAE